MKPYSSGELEVSVESWEAFRVLGFQGLGFWGLGFRVLGF